MTHAAITFRGATDGFQAKLGESPFWDAVDGCIWWVDIDSRLLCRSTADGSAIQHWSTPEMPGFVVVTAPHGVAIGMESGIFSFDPATAAFERIVDLHQPGDRFNDATVDGSGRLWAGTMDIEAKRPSGALYAIGADRFAKPILNGLRTTNGLAADALRGRLYVSDTNQAVQKVWSMPLDLGSGAVGERTEFADFTKRAGRPDGAALDETGRYWIAGVGGSALHCFDPDGTHLAAHPVPGTFVTKPAFIGDRLDRLCITSKGGETPEDGRLAFSGPLGFTGQIIPPWRIGPG